MAWQGIDLLQTGDRIVFRAFLQDSSGALITSGITTLKLYELQNDGTLKSYDWNDATFKTTALTTETQSLTHRTGNNGGTNTGLWTYALTTLSGFTAGNLYVASINHSSASPTDQARLFQFGVSAAFDPYNATSGGLGNLDATVSSRAIAGDAMALTSGERSTLAAAIEAAMINEGDATALLEAIADKIASDLESGDVTAAAIATAVWAAANRTLTAATNIDTATRDAILDRVLAANHETAGTLGKLLQSITEGRLAELDAENLPADIDALKGVIVDKLDDMLEDNAGTFRFTAAALALAPGGGGSVVVSVSASSVAATTLSDTGRLSISRHGAARWTANDLGTLSGRTKFWFAVKRKHTDDDDDAILLAEETAGLLRVNGEAAGDSTGMTITVDDEDLGDVSFVIKHAVTAQLTDADNLFYQYKWLPADGQPLELLNYRDPDVRCDIYSGVIQATA